MQWHNRAVCNNSMVKAIFQSFSLHIGVLVHQLGHTRRATNALSKYEYPNVHRTIQYCIWQIRFAVRCSQLFIFFLFWFSSKMCPQTGAGICPRHLATNDASAPRTKRFLFFFIFFHFLRPHIYFAETTFSSCLLCALALSVCARRIEGRCHSMKNAVSCLIRTYRHRRMCERFKLVGCCKQKWNVYEIQTPFSMANVR